MKHLDKRNLAGWIAIGLSTAVTCFWAFWGIIENFHEGWFYESLLMNLGLMFAQYLSFMFIFMGVTLVSIYWPRVGAGLHVIGALFAFWFFGGASNSAIILIMSPLLIFAALYWFGRPQPRKLATYLIIGLPLLTLIISGAEPVTARLATGQRR